MNDILERRGASKVVHFHCDHFEPFRANAAGTKIGFDFVSSWLEQAGKLPWGVKASLFYLSKRYCVSLGRQESQYPVPGDFMAIRDSSTGEEDAEILRSIASHDIHMHIHHEFWSSGVTTKTEVNSELDALRFECMLKLLLKYYEEVLGRKMDLWSFVHGCWALNASDTSICNITNEIEILHRNGCRGDFSFPAGRSQCDPTLKYPFFIKPTNAAKCYDTPEADPIPSGVACPRDRFLIWSTAAPYASASLDNYWKEKINPLVCAEQFLKLAPVINNVMYLKTHCHSMWWEFWKDERGAESPLLTKPVADLFNALERHCRDALEYWTVTDVMKELCEP